MIPSPTHLTLSRLTGLAYLALAICGGVAFMYARPRNLTELRVAAELGTVVAQAVAAVFFFRLLRARPGDAFAVAAFGMANALLILVSAAALTADLPALSGALWSTGGVFFGLWLIPMGRATPFAPLRYTLIIGGLGYILSSFIGYADALTVPATVGEMGMIGYLFKGFPEDQTH